MRGNGGLNEIADQASEATKLLLIGLVAPPHIEVLTGAEAGMPASSLRLEPFSAAFALDGSLVFAVMVTQPEEIDPGCPLGLDLQVSDGVHDDASCAAVIFVVVEDPLFDGWVGGFDRAVVPFNHLSNLQ
jgi:hypothetical protein